MFTTTTRGRLQAAGALMISIMLMLMVALTGGSIANAQTNPDSAQPVPESVDVTITKFAQPETLGVPATGEVAATLPEKDQRIADVVFNYYLVPGFGKATMATNQGQKDAASIVPSGVDTTGDPTGSFDATSPMGETTKTLERGLYVVKEDPTSVPEGVTAAAPFMLAVPLTDPENRDQWLDHIYVYPKNSRIAAEKTVENETAYLVGDTVTWTINADIPRIENPAYDGTNAKFIAPDYFRIDDTLQAGQLELTPAYAAGESTTSIRVTADGTSLTEGTDYTINPIVETTPAVGTTYQIIFTDTGLGALATAVNLNSTARVSVEIDTRVLASDKIINTANIYPNNNSVTQNKPLTTQQEEVRYGGYNFQKDSTDDSVKDLSGAEFRVYRTLTDAQAGNEEYLQPLNGGHTAGVWTTNNEGHISISGLRHSGYADGKSFTDPDPRFVTYYLVETKALDGHQLLAEPVPFTVGGDSGTTTPAWESDETIINQANTGAFVLPLTGGSGTAMLTIAGIAILAVVLFLARRRSAAEV